MVPRLLLSLTRRLHIHGIRTWLARISYFLRQTGSKPFSCVGWINAIEIFGLIVQTAITQSRLVIKNYVRKQMLVMPQVQTQRNKRLFGKDLEASGA